MAMQTEERKKYLELLARERGVRLAVLTKGDLLDQQNKLRRSGLAPLFDHVSIVADKTEQEYCQLCRAMGIAPNELLMVGNSFKSDIEPALNIGAWAAYIPFHITWAHEHIDEYEHEHLVTLSHFGELLDYIEKGGLPLTAYR